MDGITPQEIEVILSDERRFHEIAKAAFEEVDTDHSGYIDEAELKAMMVSVADDMEVEPPSDVDIADILKELDSNGDGTISLREFKKLIKEVLERIMLFGE